MASTLDSDIWACADADMALFFDLLEDGKRVKLDDIRERYCTACPARAACLALALDAEGRVGAKERSGIFGGFTPHQRYSLHRRQLATRCSCGLRFDPNELRAGRAHCEDCGYYEVFEAIPDHGDGWSDRHSKLATEAVAWLVENVGVGDEVPNVTWMAKTLGAQRADMRRVFDALVADGTLHEEGRTLVRVADAAAMRRWQPRTTLWPKQLVTITQND